MRGLGGHHAGNDHARRATATRAPVCLARCIATRRRLDGRREPARAPGSGQQGLSMACNGAHMKPLARLGGHARLSGRSAHCVLEPPTTLVPGTARSTRHTLSSGGDSWLDLDGTSRSCMSTAWPADGRHDTPRCATTRPSPACPRRHAPPGRDRCERAPPTIKNKEANLGKLRARHRSQVSEPGIGARSSLWNCETARQRRQNG